MNIVDTSDSAVGTGRRDSRDFYETPYGLIESAYGFLSRSPKSILDVGAGRGRWGEIAREYWPNAEIWGVDRFFTPPFDGELYDMWVHGDFLQWAYDEAFEHCYDLVVSNPPFKLAEEFVRNALPLVKDTGKAIFLLPLNFICGQKRAKDFYRTYAPTSIHTLARRPNFGGTSGPKYEYMLAVWDMPILLKSNFKPNTILYIGHQWEYDLARENNRGIAHRAI